MPNSRKMKTFFIFELYSMQKHPKVNEVYVRNLLETHRISFIADPLFAELKTLSKKNGNCYWHLNDVRNELKRVLWRVGAVCEDLTGRFEFYD